MHKLSALRAGFKTWRAAKRFSRLTRHFDKQIEQARREHRAIRHILAAKREFIHAALRS